MENKMKLSVMAMTLLLAGSSVVSAQNWRNAPKYHFGVRAGITDTNSLDGVWDGDDGTWDMFAPSFGVAFDAKVAKLPFYVETGMYYMNRGLKYKYSVYPHQKYSATVDNNSILVPALISYHAYVNKNVAFQPFMGPYLAYGFDDEEFDSGWRIGCGFNVKKFYANVGIDFGLKDSFDSHPGYISSLFMTVGWNFLGDR